MKTTKKRLNVFVLRHREKIIIAMGLIIVTLAIGLILK